MQEGLLSAPQLRRDDQGEVEEKQNRGMSFGVCFILAPTTCARHLVSGKQLEIRSSLYVLWEECPGKRNVRTWDLVLRFHVMLTVLSAALPTRGNYLIHEKSRSHQPNSNVHSEASSDC